MGNVKEEKKNRQVGDRLEPRSPVGYLLAVPTDIIFIELLHTCRFYNRAINSTCTRHNVELAM